jgi:murein DD-endopeptidase MepM/ murein hydrolase activator NlpD
LSGVKNKGVGRVPVSRSFHERLLLFNNLDSLGFKEWIFQPAMLFGSLDKWWGDFGKRQRPHEGLDLCLYRTKEGNINYLTGETKIPVIFEGQVVKVSADFLGESVFVGHNAYNSSGNRLYTIYGHIKPGKHIRPGKRLSEGDIIGVIADTGDSGVATPRHLHVSAAWIPNTMPVPELGWQTINDPARVVLLDPLSIIECPYSVTSELQLPGAPN